MDGYILLKCFHTAGVTGSIPVPPTILKYRRNKDLENFLGRCHFLVMTNEGLSRRELEKSLVAIDRHRALLLKRWGEIHGDAYGASITIPIKLIPDLKGASPSEVRTVEVLGRGGGLHWECLDLDLSVPALVSSVFAGPQWMAQLGRVGGLRSSAAKTAAARSNGRKGGRPRLRATADA
jgi:hypothetical protein